MAVKDHGYYGYAYIGARVAQLMSLIPVIGLVANFLSLIARSKHSPPQELIATIVVVSNPHLKSLLPYPCVFIKQSI